MKQALFIIIIIFTLLHQQNMSIERFGSSVGMGWGGVLGPFIRPVSDYQRLSHKHVADD